MSLDEKAILTFEMYLNSKIIEYSER